jgi:hypothetical protein
VTHDGNTPGGTPLATDAGAIAYAIALGSWIYIIKSSYKGRNRD